MEWSEIGNWIKGNGLPVVASLLTGGTSAALATGISLIQSATGEVDADKAMASLKNSPEAMVRLKELTFNNEADIRKHLTANAQMALDDKHNEHSQTQATVQNGDNAKGKIKWVRPTHSTASLMFAMFYAATAATVEFDVLALFLALPFSYGGLRTIDKLGFNPLKR
jgi:hypothetical protein